MLNVLTDTLYDINIVNAVFLSERLQLKVTKRKIREIFFEISKNKDSIAIKDYCEGLAKIGVEVSPTSIPAEAIVKVNVPFLLFIEKINSKYFSLITEVSKESIKIFNPYKNIVEEFNSEDVLERDKFIGIVIKNVDINFIEDNYFVKLEKEKNLVKDYDNKIKIIKKILSNEECDDIINYCESLRLLIQSEINSIDENGKVYSGYSEQRTSYSAKLSHYPNIGKILERIASLLNSEVDKLEIPGCLRYEVGQEFKMHHDSFNGDERKNTIIIYLNDDFKGGETYFPEVNRKVAPQKGTCLVFPDIDENLNIITESLHAGLPVENGRKYILVCFELRNANVKRDVSDYVKRRVH